MPVLKPEARAKASEVVAMSPCEVFSRNSGERTDGFFSYSVGCRAHLSRKLVIDEWCVVQNRPRAKIPSGQGMEESRKSDFRSMIAHLNLQSSTCNCLACSSIVCHDNLYAHVMPRRKPAAPAGSATLQSFQY